MGNAESAPEPTPEPAPEPVTVPSVEHDPSLTEMDESLTHPQSMLIHPPCDLSPANRPLRLVGAIEVELEHQNMVLDTRRQDPPPEGSTGNEDAGPAPTPRESVRASNVASSKVRRIVLQDGKPVQTRSLLDNMPSILETSHSVATTAAGTVVVNNKINAGNIIAQPMTIEEKISALAMSPTDQKDGPMPAPTSSSNGVQYDYDRAEFNHADSAYGFEVFAHAPGQTRTNEKAYAVKGEEKKEEEEPIAGTPFTGDGDHVLSHGAPELFSDHDSVLSLMETSAAVFSVLRQAATANYEDDATYAAVDNDGAEDTAPADVMRQVRDDCEEGDMTTAIGFLETASAVSQVILDSQQRQSQSRNQEEDDGSAGREADIQDSVPFAQSFMIEDGISVTDASQAVMQILQAAHTGMDVDDATIADASVRLIGMMNLSGDCNARSNHNDDDAINDDASTMHGCNQSVVNGGQSVMTNISQKSVALWKILDTCATEVSENESSVQAFNRGVQQLLMQQRLQHEQALEQSRLRQAAAAAQSTNSAMLPRETTTIMEDQELNPRSQREQQQQQQKSQMPAQTETTADGRDINESTQSNNRSSANMMSRTDAADGMQTSPSAPDPQQSLRRKQAESPGQILHSASQSVSQATTGTIMTRGRKDPGGQRSRVGMGKYQRMSLHELVAARQAESKRKRSKTSTRAAATSTSASTSRPQQRTPRDPEDQTNRLTTQLFNHYSNMLTLNTKPATVHANSVNGEDPTPQHTNRNIDLNDSNRESRKADAMRKPQKFTFALNGLGSQDEGEEKEAAASRLPSDAAAATVTTGEQTGDMQRRVTQVTPAELKAAGQEKEEIDMEFVELYDAVFNEFIGQNPRFLIGNPDLVHNMRVAKLQKLFEYNELLAAHYEDELQRAQKAKAEDQKKLMAELREASQRKAASEITQQRNLHTFQSNATTTRARMVWELVSMTEQQEKIRATLKQSLEAPLANGDFGALMRAIPDELLEDGDKKSSNNSSSNSSSNSTASNGNISSSSISSRSSGSRRRKQSDADPNAPKPMSLKDAISQQPLYAVQFNDKCEQALRKAQVDNAFLNAESAIVQKKLKPAMKAAKKHVWVAQKLRTITPQGMDHLRQKYAESMDVEL